MAGDAPFSVDPATLKAAVTCPNGIRKAPGGEQDFTVLLNVLISILYRRRRVPRAWNWRDWIWIMGEQSLRSVSTIKRVAREGPIDVLLTSYLPWAAPGFDICW